MPAWGSVAIVSAAAATAGRPHPTRSTRGSNHAGWGARPLMTTALVFLGVATLLGCLLRGMGELRIRVRRQPDMADGELCGLERANRITSVAVVASLVGLAVVGLAYVVV